MIINNLEIEKNLVVSTGHITKKDDELLTKESEMLEEKETLFSDSLELVVFPQPFDYGYYICTVEKLSDRDIKVMKKFGYSNALIDLIKLSHDNGCSFLKLDRDGKLYNELPIYDWSMKRTYE